MSPTCDRIRAVAPTRSIKWSAPTVSPSLQSDVFNLIRGSLLRDSVDGQVRPHECAPGFDMGGAPHAAVTALVWGRFSASCKIFGLISRRIAFLKHGIFIATLKSQGVPQIFKEAVAGENWKKLPLVIPKLR